jgi:hypothetical protein
VPMKGPANSSSKSSADTRWPPAFRAKRGGIADCARCPRRGESRSRWPLIGRSSRSPVRAWLRHHRRPADLRAPLRAAHEAFDALGATRWGEHARQELRASGTTSRRRSRDLTDRLSPQELRIVHLAASGLSNRNIGRAFYCPPYGRFAPVSDLPEAWSGLALGATRRAGWVVSHMTQLLLRQQQSADSSGGQGTRLTFG